MIHSRTNDGGTSCLMVTQPHREALMRRSVECFRRQTHAPRELVVVHSGDAGFHRRVLDMAHVLDDARMTVVAADSSRRLGALRNLAVAHARCEFVCQWDDDDLHHPEYLARQHTNLLASGADFSFLTDQWHYYERRGFVFWDDWSPSAPRWDLIEGTLYGRRACLPDYPDLAIGEDTPVVREIVKAGRRIARLADSGWLMMYTWHGANAWPFEHHLAISRLRRLSRAMLAERLAVIESALAAYPLEEVQLRFPHEAGWFEFRRAENGWRLTESRREGVLAG